MGGRGGSSGITRGGAPLGSLTRQQYLNDTGWDPGLSSPNGEMKRITLYYGADGDFSDFDNYSGTRGIYLTANRRQAESYGNNVYTVDVKYSTNKAVAERTGREMDFSYDPRNGHWVIPLNKRGNLKIKKKERVNR